MRFYLPQPTDFAIAGGGYLAALLALAACSGTIEEPGASFGTPGSPGRGVPGATAGSGAGQLPGNPGRPPNGGAGNIPDDPERDVNRVAIHRLNNTEYDNTVRDLLGVRETPARSFISDEQAFGFDSIADALGMTEAQYEQYWNAAGALTDAAFADPALRARIVSCTPASATDTRCSDMILTTFGRRALRRPLLPAELARLTSLTAKARELGADFDGSIAHAVRALLASAAFLYRIELDDDPASPVAHPLNDYELASRLSYLLWSTMPDDALLDAAERGELQQDAMLSAQLARMLDDPRAERFVASFAGQWLGLRGLASHQVDATVFPDWEEPLRAAMIQEGLAYFGEFVHGGRSLSEFFSADVHFVDGTLAELYDLDGADFDPQTPLSVTTDARRGFLGLASFLTFTSFSYRTAPTLRGKWVLENLLCEEIPPPPADVPELEEEAPGGDTQSLNVRERLAEHRVNPACAGCHQILDPIGLGLENFDAIGRYRTSYAAGDAIDASGMLPSGETFDGLLELSTLLADDPRLADCASEKLLTYALSRQLVESDDPYLQELRDGFAREGLQLRALLEQIVLSDLFRFRRGETAP